MLSSSVLARSEGSPVGRTGGFSRAFCGRKASSSRTLRSTASSPSASRWATPDFLVCTSAPPSSLKVTSSRVTDLITSGPVMNIYDDPRFMMMKSVSAGLYTAPPAHGPRMAEICGTTPE